MLAKLLFDIYWCAIILLPLLAETLYSSQCLTNFNAYSPRTIHGILTPSKIAPPPRVQVVKWLSVKFDSSTESSEMSCRTICQSLQIWGTWDLFHQFPPKQYTNAECYAWSNHDCHKNGVSFDFSHYCVWNLAFAWLLYLSPQCKRSNLCNSQLLCIKKMQI